MADILDLTIAELVADGFDRERVRHAVDRIRRSNGGMRHYIRQSKAERRQEQIAACGKRSVEEIATMCHVSKRTVFRYRHS